MSSYRVQSGDTLGAIASRFHTTVSALAQTNHIANPNLIYAGSVLEIPDAFAPAPPPAPVNLAQPSSAGGIHTVTSGECLSGIAARYGTTVGALASLNGIANPNLIYVGQQLRIPGAGNAAPAPAPAPASPPPSSSGGSYTVRSGDTLSGIAARFGTTVGALASLNGIANPNLIYAGQTLRLPGGSVQGPAPVGPVPGPVNGGISLGQLEAIMPSLPDSKARAYLPYLNQAMVSGGINTPQRQAAFLAQLAHESGQLKYFEELASGAAYEGRTDLGNTQPGDGVRYKGRGPIQLTGRANYAAASRALGIDLVNNPTRAADPDVGFKIAVWFWNSRNLSAYADAGNFDAITYRINGGYNGKAARDAYWATAKRVLGA